MALKEESRLILHVIGVDDSKSDSWKLQRPESWADLVIPQDADRDRIIREMGTRERYFIVDHAYEDVPQDHVGAPQDHGSDINLCRNVPEVESRLVFQVVRVEESQCEAWRLPRPDGWADIVIHPRADRHNIIQQMGRRTRYFIVDHVYDDAPQEPIPYLPVAPQDPDTRFSLCRFLMPALCGGIILASFAHLSGEEVISQISWFVEAVKAACNGGADVWTAVEGLNIARQGFSSFL